MSQAIYRKYRPKKFADVTNQNHVKVTLQNQIITDKVAHAYIFAGPRGIGKTTLARLLAKAVNCHAHKDGEPCNECDHCQHMNEGRALDVIEIDAASHTGVDNVRENIIEASRFTPGQGKYKIFIIDEVHMLSTSAFNALLKTLEEPPERVIFVLATTEVHKIPATILSRCQRFDFHRIATSEIVVRLQQIAKEEKVKVEEEVLTSIARLSEGCLRDAESLFGQILALGETEIGYEQASLILPVTNTTTVVELVDALSRADQKSAIETVNNFVDQGGSIKNLTDETIDLVRTMMLFSLGGLYNESYDAQTMGSVKKMLERIDANDCRRLIDLLLDARNRSTHDTLPQLPLEIVAVEFCSRSEAKTKDNRPPPPQTPSAPISGNQPSVPEVKKDAPNASFSIQELKDKWQRCIKEVAKQNIALPISLQCAEPRSVNGSEIVLGFAHSFHFETFKDPKNSKILSEAVAEIMQTTVTIRPVYLKEEEEAVVENLVQEFGGAIVE
ncbi:MAG: DNA polymerase III subunit gamma/tau [Patescibacteria group bacterium]